MRSNEIRELAAILASTAVRDGGARCDLPLSAVTGLKQNHFTLK